MSGVTVTVPSTGIFIKGYNLDLSFLTCSDNSYVMFDGATAGNVFFQDITLTTSGTASQVFDLTDATGFNAVELVRVNFNDCTAIGELNGYRQGLETNTGRFGGTPEMTLSGTWIGGYFIDVSIVRGLTNGGMLYTKRAQVFQCVVGLELTKILIYLHQHHSLILHPAILPILRQFKYKAHLYRVVVFLMLLIPISHQT
ncbi:hypothetical protein [Lysinibacillus pakistanensis]|uniref:Uncharacterized protein n=2 Tax=Bacteria TaxID=2 RepID=A0ABX6DHK0_9BACI|nr:hypothetical protein GDS87_24385 [Lysinibacillus pakistanensis]QGG54116.1 hypothetical protein GDS87_24665 [Lysinibacillus pakistanensis]